MALDIVRPSELTEDDQIVSAVVVSFPGHARIETCYSLRFWDEGYGPAWQYRDAGGLDAVIRARTWEQAYECFIDEIADDATCICPLKWNGHSEPTADETRADDDCPIHGLHRKDHDRDLPEGCHFRSNGVPSSDWGNHKTAIAQTDLNGESLQACPDVIDGDRYAYYLIVERD